MSDKNARTVIDASSHFDRFTDDVEMARSKFQVPNPQVKNQIPRFKMDDGAKPRDLEDRTFEFAQSVRAFGKQLPRTLSNTEDVRQLVRASGSVAAVMTGFGRTGRMFASEYEGVIPDVMDLGKGLTGGYLPLAVTLISEKLFCAFDGSVANGRALAYGHSYTGNALGCAAAKASLEVFENEGVWEALQPKIRHLSSALASLKRLPVTSEVRQCGFIAGIQTARVEMAAAVCIEARRHGLLSRQIGNVVVLMRPLCITTAQLSKAVEALHASITEVSRSSNGVATKNVEEITA
jgi:adenosylmethionine-8-amino-7-oxononanoate aminotransferase